MNLEINRLKILVADPESFWKVAVTTATDLLQIFSFPEFFSSSASSLASLLQADGAALIVYDGPEYLRYRLFYGLEFINQKAISTFTFSSTKGTVGRVLNTGVYLFTEDYQNSMDSMPEFVASGLKSNLVFPLPGPQGYIGAVAISWLKHKAAKPDESTLAVVKMFAALLGSLLYREKLEIELGNLARHDPLTGLANRRELMIRLEEAQKRAARHQTLLVVVVLDLDGFKRFNDVFGHAEGDKILIRTAKKLREIGRATDMIARMGGDEFVVILEDVKSLVSVEKILGRIVSSLAAKLEKDGEFVEISTSVGAAVYPLDFVNSESLLIHADKAMYSAKRAGGNRFVVVSSEQNR